MKAFVIKNKEGKYFESQCIANGEPRFYANQFLVFTNKDEAKAVLENIAEDCDYFNIACEVVEITIAEVNKNFEPQNYDNLNTEDKLKYRDEQVRLAVERSVDDYNKITDLEFHIKRLEEQLAEKDKEINKLSKEHFEMFGDMKDYKNLWLAEQRKNKEICKQVCDEFKKAIITESIFDTEEEASYWTDDIDVKTILEIIDKLEQGEQQ